MVTKLELRHATKQRFNKRIGGGSVAEFLQIAIQIQCKVTTSTNCQKVSGAQSEIAIYTCSYITNHTTKYQSCIPNEKVEPKPSTLLRTWSLSWQVQVQDHTAVSVSACVYITFSLQYIIQLFNNFPHNHTSMSFYPIEVQPGSQISTMNSSILLLDLQSEL